MFDPKVVFLVLRKPKKQSVKSRILELHSTDLSLAYKKYSFLKIYDVVDAP
jgi:hypothetical protein